MIAVRTVIAAARFPRAVARPIAVAAAVLTRDHEAFLVRRARGRPLAGQWEFPGGKVKFGEHPLEALRRELREELDFRLGTATLFGVYSHVYTIRARRVHYVLLVYRGRVGLRVLPEDAGSRWFGPRAILRLPVVAGSKPIVADLLRSWRVT